MKLRQNARHFASRAALETPGVRSLARRGLVRLHTRVFLERADPERREERREHLDALFDATVDAYLAALRAGYDEAEAREVTHVMANLDFHRQRWTEMMEFPTDEVDVHRERYAAFFDEHGVTVEDPLGDFAPEGDLPAAPRTPERLDAEQPHAEGGYADAAYVETEDGVVEGGREDPEAVSVADAPGVDEGAVADWTDEEAD